MEKTKTICLPLNILPHTSSLVAYCIRIWCMLDTVPRSTRHSAVGLAYADDVHSPPTTVRFDLCPSTARSAECPLASLGWSCHAVLRKARFSVKCEQVYDLLFIKKPLVLKVYTSRFSSSFKMQYKFICMARFNHR